LQNKAKPTALNKRLALTALFGRFGFRKNAVGLRPLCIFTPPHFFAPVKMLRIFPYRAQKNVANLVSLCEIFLQKPSEKIYT
jgi:hypothetical protein